MLYIINNLKKHWFLIQGCSNLCQIGSHSSQAKCIGPALLGYGERVQRISYQNIHFLGYGLYTLNKWETILKFTLFEWMKKHKEKFESRFVWEVCMLENGGMTRKDCCGLAREEVVEENIAREMGERGMEFGG